MAEKGLNDLELLSQEDLLVGGMRHFFESYAELRRREDVTRDWLKSLCGFSLENMAWYTLFEGGGAQRFTDILKTVGCSRTTLGNVLRNLLNAGLVRMVEGRYQAVSPVWLVHFSEPNRRIV